MQNKIVIATYITENKSLNLQYNAGIDAFYEKVPMPTRKDARKYLDENGAKNLGMTVWL